MKRFIFTITVFLLLPTWHSYAQTFPDTLAKQFQSVLNARYAAKELTGVSAAIIMPDKGIWQGVAGKSGPNSEVDMNSDMLFWTGCIDMMFTASTILQLVEEDELELADPLYKWLPELTKYTNIDSNITIRQLLNHTNGLYRWHLNHNDPPDATDSVKVNPDKYWGLEEFLLKFIVNHPKHLPPGLGWDYHESDYVLLNMIIEKITNTDPYIQYRDRIGIPLELDNTYFIWSDTISAEIAQSSEDWIGLWKTAMWSIGGRRIISNPLDIAHFIGKLFDGQILNLTSLDRMSTFLDIATAFIPSLDGYGLGLCRFDLANHETWGHFGFDPGYSSAVVYWPEKETCIAFFFNNWGYTGEVSVLSEELFKEVLNYYNFPFDKIHPKDINVEKPFFEAGEDSLPIFSHVHNPGSHNVQVKAIISNKDGSFIDSTLLYDDGTNGDMVSGDSLYSCRYKPIFIEDYFTVSVKTTDLDTMYHHILPEDSVARFTTIGPLEIHDLYPTGRWGTDILIGPGDTLSYKISVHNKGKTTTAQNIKVKIISNDTLFRIGTTKIITFGDIEPGASPEASKEFLIICSDDCPHSANLPLTFEIYSNDFRYWTEPDTLTVIESESEMIPLEFALYQNYPNPFNPVTVISWQLAVGSEVDLSIYNLLGQKVVTLVSERQKAGIHTVEWDANGLASGVYYYQLRTDAGFIQTKKLLLLK